MAGVITALKTQSKNRDRVNVFLDGTYQFSISWALAEGLRIGETYSEQQIGELKQRDQEEVNYRRALRLISRRPRSEYELRNYFKQRQVPIEVQDNVLDRLREVDLVDDSVFARTWVENRLTFRPRSSLMLRDELRKKGVPRDAIEAALEDYDDERAAHLAAQKAARRWSDSDWDEFQRRVGAYLTRRGFVYSLISPVVARVWRETTGCEDESEV
ncbi:MAG: RecX family transcriptional regulator [Anaerolineaceae bacterium]|nr:MAG: RecX family transcriptional regulator [Anaerolineaceae bacterium]